MQGIAASGIQSRLYLEWRPDVLGNRVGNKVGYWPYTVQVPLAKEWTRLGRVVESCGSQSQAGSMGSFAGTPVVQAGCCILVFVE